MLSIWDSSLFIMLFKVMLPFLLFSTTLYLTQAIWQLIIHYISSFCVLRYLTIFCSAPINKHHRTKRLTNYCAREVKKHIMSTFKWSRHSVWSDRHIFADINGKTVCSYQHHSKQNKVTNHNPPSTACVATSSPLIFLPPYFCFDDNQVLGAWR